MACDPSVTRSAQLAQSIARWPYRRHGLPRMRAGDIPGMGACHTADGTACFAEKSDVVAGVRPDDIAVLDAFPKALS